MLRALLIIAASLSALLLLRLQPLLLSLALLLRVRICNGCG